MKHLPPTCFGAMLWKEVRENAVWAALGALALLAVNYMVFFDLTKGAVMGSHPGSSLLDSWLESGSALVICTGVGPLLAALLGAMQIVPELRRDQWAFLIHRPLSFATNFRYKATAGLSLYFLAMGGTFLLLWALRWSMISRSAPELPFDWHFLLGGLADILVGVPCYFAAMLCAVRATRWYGSRFISLIGCIALVVYNLEFEEFSHVLAAVLVYSLVLGFAARSSFMGQGQYRSQSKSGRLALGLSLLPGLLTLGTIAAVMLDKWLQSAFFEISNQEPDNAFVRYGVAPDGELVQEIHSAGFAQAKIKDLDGNEKKVDTQHVRYLEGYLADDYTTTFRSSRRYFIDSEYIYDYEYAVPPVHFTVYSKKMRLLLLFTQNRNFVGYITPTGFYARGEPLPRNSGFEGELVASISDGLYWFTDGIYRLENGQKTIRRIVSMSDIEAASWQAVYGEIPRATSNPALGAPADYPMVSRKLMHLSLAIVTPTTVEFRGKELQPLFHVPREHNSHLYPNITTQMNRAGNRFYVLYRPGSDIPEVKRRELPLFLVTYNEKGQVQARHKLPPASAQQNWVGIAFRQMYCSWLGLPLVILAGYAAYVLSDVIGYDVAFRLWPAELAFHLPDIALIAMLSLGSAIVSCIVLWLLRRRSGLTRQSLMAWMIAVFALGPVGLLLFLAMRGWPSRVACLNCGKQRAVHFNHCENCGAPWPVRPKDSADIFPTAPTTNS